MLDPAAFPFPFEQTNQRPPDHVDGYVLHCEVSQDGPAIPGAALLVDSKSPRFHCVLRAMPVVPRKDHAPEYWSFHSSVHPVADFSLSNTRAW